MKPLRFVLFLFILIVLSLAILNAQSIARFGPGDRIVIANVCEWPKYRVVVETVDGPINLNAQGDQRILPRTAVVSCLEVKDPTREPQLQIFNPPEGK